MKVKTQLTAMLEKKGLGAGWRTALGAEKTTMGRIGGAAARGAATGAALGAIKFKGSKKGAGYGAGIGAAGGAAVGLAKGAVGELIRGKKGRAKLNQVNTRTSAARGRATKSDYDYAKKAKSPVRQRVSQELNSRARSKAAKKGWETRKKGGSS